MPTDKQEQLIKEHIIKSYHEILLQNIVFVLMNCVSLFIIGFILYKVFIDQIKTTDDYSKLIQAAAALFVPYLTFIAQGFCFPRRRKICSLRHLLFVDELAGDDLKCLYEK